MGLPSPRLTRGLPSMSMGSQGCAVHCISERIWRPRLCLFSATQIFERELNRCCNVHGYPAASIFLVGPRVGHPVASVEFNLLKTVSYEVNSVGTRPTIQGRSRMSENVRCGEIIARNCLKSRPKICPRLPSMSIAIQWQQALSGGILRWRKQDAPNAHYRHDGAERQVAGTALQTQ